MAVPEIRQVQAEEMEGLVVGREHPLLLLRLEVLGILQTPLHLKAITVVVIRLIAVFFALLVVAAQAQLVPMEALL